MPNPPSKNSKNIALPAGFSARLRQLREVRNLSKNDLADLAGTTSRTVQNLETGRHQRFRQGLVPAQHRQGLARFFAQWNRARQFGLAPGVAGAGVAFRGESLTEKSAG